MAKIYEDGTYLKNNPKWHEDDSPWKASKILKMLNKNNIEPKKNCEIGCGAGEVINSLSKYYSNDCQLVGYEISPQAYELSSKKVKHNLSYKLSDALSGDSETFDVAMVIDVFEHVENYFDFLRRLNNKAEYKIFHIPLDLSVQTVLRSDPIIRGRKLVGHIHYFTKETALETLKDCGYSIVDHFYTGGSLDLPNRGWKSNLLKIPRKILFSLNKDITVRLLGGYSLMVLAK